MMKKVMAEGEASGSIVGGSWSTPMVRVPPCCAPAVPDLAVGAGAAAEAAVGAGPGAVAGGCD
jgi:hypothetical protein